MLYTIKPSDTLSKIAARHKVPLDMLLAVNPKIKNANLIYVGQVILIPTLEENPEPPKPIIVHDGSFWVARAKSAINQAIGYKLGHGGMHPDHNLPTKTGLCDCSGFTAWVFGVKRETDIPFYHRFNGWINTDSMVADIQSSVGIFESIDIPEPGCIVVYGRQRRGTYGHVGIVSEVKNGAMVKVIHCSSGNDRNFGGRSIQETGPGVFLNKPYFLGRFSG
jgi:LysM repeat protein